VVLGEEKPAEHAEPGAAEAGEMWDRGWGDGDGLEA